MFDFKNMKVGKKIRTGFAVVLGLLILVAGVAYFALSNSSDGVARYRAIARNTNILGQVQSNLLMVRMNVKEFLITSSQKNVDRFEDYYKKTGELLDESLELIRNPERVAILKDSGAKLEKYHAGFGEVVAKQMIRQERFTSVLNVNGPKMEKALTEILTTARRDGDMNAAYYTSQATRSLLLGRLYVMKYLESNADADAARVKSEFEDMGGHLDTLDRSLQNRERRALLAQVTPMLSTYTQAFGDVVAAITERNKVVKGTMDVLGPEIADMMEKIKSQYKSEQDTLGPQLMEDNRNATIAAILASILAIVFGLLMARKVARMIVDPLSEMVTAANGLAQGDINQAIEADSEDEIGELAGAFQKMIESQKEMAMATEAVSKGDISVSIAPRSTKDIMAISLKEMIAVLKDLMADVNKTIHNVKYGKLTMRADAGSYHGAWQDLLGGINVMTDVLVGQLDNIPTPAMVVDREFNIQYMNQFGAELIGLPSEQLVGTKCYNHFKTSHCQTSQCACSLAMQNRSKVTQETDAHPGGHDLDIQYIGAPILDESGKAVGCLEFITDLTDIKRAVRVMKKQSDYQSNEIVNLIADLDKISAGDLTVVTTVADADEDTREVRENFIKISSGLNNTVKSLQETLQQVALAVDQVAAAGNQIASSSQAVAEGASEQASSLEETSSSLEEMASMTRQNADNAQQADAMSREAGDVAEQGGQAMGQMSEAMKQIRQAAVGTSAIIRDINEIAFQTNLLALNAAVEAARAGEAGRGFAVVAEEVRNLALRSKDAAKKTEDLINESVALSEGGEKISVDMNEKLSKVTLSIEKVGGIIGEIASASQEQARGIEQVNKAVAEMDKVTQQNAANSEESSSASEELAGQAQELMAMVGRFKLGEHSSHTANRASSAGTKILSVRKTKRLPSKPKNGQDMMLRPEDIIPMEGDPDFKDF